MHDPSFSAHGLLPLNTATGLFKLTLGLQKAADLNYLAPFPMTSPAFARKVHDLMPAVLADRQIDPFLDGDLHEFGPLSVPLQHVGAEDLLKLEPPPKGEGGQGVLF